ncbi:MAG: RagB/SusD family nutrient uptake outer membrane protein [Chitinophagaceae bacterium]|nr:MAG: RagB/SusD family nutrient uptake outer membrane protein [Chitinophagaceae bacterium]
MNTFAYRDSINFIRRIFYGLLRQPFLIAIILILNLATACKKFVEIPPPKDKVVTATVFKADATAISAINGLYAQIMSGNMTLLNGAMSLYPGLSADAIYNTNTGSNTQPFAKNSILPDNAINANLWARGYAYIYQINAIMEGLSNSGDAISLATKNQLLGEACFMRAFCYFYLTNLYGDVPLELAINYKSNEKMPRTPQAKVYGQIISDLQNATKLLTTDYVTGDRARPNKWAAIALLARVYLYQQQWSKADSAATAIIMSGAYSLENNPQSVFLKGSSETIWQLIPVSPGFNTAEGYTFIPYSSSVIPRYSLSTHLLASFEPGDIRKEDWIDSSEINYQIYYYPYKYKVALNSDVTECNVVLRLAEQYLIAAEAKANEGDILGAENNLNVIRNRAGLKDTPANDKASLLSAIEQERRVELFCEWGHRWFDLRRTNRLNQVMSVEKTGWNSTDALYPIPEAEIQSNPALIQNAGY